MTVQLKVKIDRLQTICFVACLSFLLILLANVTAYTQPDEICDNALDDDGDGLIDLNDDDCTCELIEPISYIPNPSFEELECCPDNRSQLDCATGWAQASEPTTDFIHICGWPGWDDFLPPMPFPDGEGIMGLRDGRVLGVGAETNWKEYAGACLVNPLLAGVEYRFEFYVGFHSAQASPPIDITFFGTSDCQNLPFGPGNTNFGCPTNGPNWIRLAATNVAALGISNNRWVKATIEIIPDEDIYAIAIGPPCAPTSATVSTYYFFDNLILDEAKTFDFRISESGHPCERDFNIGVPFEPSATYQWYKEGIALIDETDPDLTLNYGEGNYQVRVVNGSFCGLSKIYTYTIPVLSEVVTRIVCSGEQIMLGQQVLSQSGEYRDTILSVNGCDSLVELTLRILDQAADTVNAKIFEGETFDKISGISISQAGTQVISLPTALGCDSVILLNLDYYHIYFPTVFSPNDDGINDRFTVLGGVELIEIRRLQIFDRWGALVFEEYDQFTNELYGWDGEQNGALVASGVYVYLATIEMDDGQLRQFNGNVMVVE